VIAALGAPLILVLAPAHVKDFYMSRAQRSLAGDYGCPRAVNED